MKEKSVTGESKPSEGSESTALTQLVGRLKTNIVKSARPMIISQEKQRHKIRQQMGCCGRTKHEVLLQHAST